jgi:hypothetical protein
MFSILSPFRKMEDLDPAKKLTDWVLFENLASDLMYPNIQILLMKLIKQHVTLQLL